MDDVKLSWPGVAPFGIEPHEYSTGVTKLATQFLVALLTPRASDPTDLDHGTDLAALLRGNYTNAQELSVYAVLAVEETVAWLLRQQQATRRPESERLASAEVVGVTYTDDQGLLVRIEIYNSLGELAAVSLPTA